MKKTLVILSVVLGIVFLGLAALYWSVPANALPSFLPGYDPAMASIHFKHGLLALILAVLLFLYAWFMTGKKKRV
jgi:hypothetical protein